MMMMMIIISVLNKWILVHSQNLIPDVNREIQEPEEEKTHKYLGIKASKGLQH